MTPDRWAQIEQLYHAARERPAEREALLAQAGPALRREVEALLAQPPASLLNSKLSAGATLAPGTLLGVYRIDSFVAAGGMGEVYKATDTRLHRTVAIKVMGDSLSRDASMHERFVREAHAIATLSHPHICPLYDIGKENGTDFLVMEYLDGETLAARLAKGPLSLKDVLRYGFEIAEALAAAHHCGILHRDLKPGNIMLTKSGAKLLDFGLAKLPDAASGNTRQLGLTGIGTLLGTLPYMAPEQVQGNSADFRADIFSFGTVLYEMAAGQAPFAADTRTALIAAILEHEPEPPSKLNPKVPPALEKLIEACLIKDRDERMQSAHDVAHAFGWIQAGIGGRAGSVAGRPQSRERLMLMALAALSAGLLAISAVHFRHRPADLRPVRFEILGPPNTGQPWYDLPSLSPDGRYLVFSAGTNSGAKPVLFLRAMDSMALRPLAGTEEAAFPFWSPDSRSVAFVANGKLKKIDLTGAPPQNLCDTGLFGDGGSWGPDGTILFASDRTGLRRVSAQGGASQNVLPLDSSRGEIELRWPHFLPDGKHFLYFSQNADAEKSEIRAGSLGSRETRSVLAAESRADFVPQGYLIFAKNRALMAQPFDASNLRVSGRAEMIAPSVAYSIDVVRSGNSLFSISNNGVLLWRSATNGTSRIVAMSREGKPLGPVGEAHAIQQITLAPDEKRIAATISNATGTNDIWIAEVASGIFSRVTSDPGGSESPVWSPDSRELVFASIRKVPSGRDPYFNLFRKRVGGPPESLLLESDEPKFPAQWLTDGSLAFWTLWSNKFYRLQLAGERQPELLFQSQFEIGGLVISPDHRWAAYVATDSGRSEVYVASYPSFTERRQVSTSGGGGPLWGRKGKELYFQSNGKVMEVDVTASATLKTGIPKELFAMPESNYDVTADGRKFFFVQNIDQSPSSLNVLLNWTAALPKP
jgi:serine/threonine protein kinase/Tol biopolymer transport system component